jgi:hypothetical protein
LGKMPTTSVRRRISRRSWGVGFVLVRNLQLHERVAPELLFLETKWASLISYGLTTRLLQDTLPVDAKLNPVSVRNHVVAVAERRDAALGDEQLGFIEGCPEEWAKLPTPDGPLVVGLDGGYVRGRPREGCFDVIVAQAPSLPQQMPERLQECVVIGAIVVVRMN